MQIEALKEEFCVCAIRDFSGVDFSAKYCFLAKTDVEKSVVCLQTEVPANATRVDAGWRCFRVKGPLEFSLIGVLADISGTLAKSGIPIFAVSTYDTDYILTKSKDFRKALDALQSSGYIISWR